MPLHNAYPEKPVVPYLHTTVDMNDVILYMKTTPIVYPVEVLRSSYVIFRNESANGADGINNNYVGMQADGNRWDDQWTSKIVGVVDLLENKGRERLFCALDNWHDSVDLLLSEVLSRGIFIGGETNYITHVEVQDESGLVTAYYREWVRGNATVVPPADVLASFYSMYAQAVEHFTSPPPPLVA